MENFMGAAILVSGLTISLVAVRQQFIAREASPRAVTSPTRRVDTDSLAANGTVNSPVFVTEIPDGYRDWRLISVAHEKGTLNDLRAILGNDIAIRAYREEADVFPDGTIIARLAWSYVASEENNKAFGRVQSFVAGHPTNGVQFMVKDSTRYAATGGWGFAHFNDGQPADAAFMQSCFPCHQAIKSRDLVFTRYSP